MVEYLADVLVRIVTHPASKIDELLPSNWASRFSRRPLELALA